MILPLLNSPDGNGGINTMETIVRLAIGAASVCFADGEVTKGTFDDKRANQIAYELIDAIMLYNRQYGHMEDGKQSQILPAYTQEEITKIMINRQ